jgi:ABC-type Fe3+-siderophore transport system permease subunit
MDALDIVKDGATAAGFAKILVDLVKLMPIPSPGAVLPILAFVFAEGSAFLLFLAGAGDVNRQSMAITVLVGIAATGVAIGATALQSVANKTEARVDAALVAPVGTTKAQVDAQVFGGTGDGK